MTLESNTVWKDALRAWIEEGRPGSDGPDAMNAYRQWCHDRFDLPLDRPLKLQERWEFDGWPISGGIPSRASMIERELKETGRSVEREGQYVARTRGPTVELYRTSGPGGRMFNPRVKVVDPDHPLLNDLLSQLLPKMLVDFGDAVMAGRMIRLDIVANGDGSGGGGKSVVLEPLIDSPPNQFKVSVEGSPAYEQGDRQILLQIAELNIRAVLQPFDGLETNAERPRLFQKVFGGAKSADHRAPPWLHDLRQIHDALMSCLHPKHRLEWCAAKV